MLVARYITFRDLRDEMQWEIWDCVNTYFRVTHPREQGEPTDTYEQRIDEETDHYLNCHNFPIAYEI